jgi:hypothetical protein
MTNNIDSGALQVKEAAAKVVERAADQAKEAAVKAADGLAASGKQLASMVIDALAERAKDLADQAVDKGVELLQTLAGKAQDAAGAVADKTHDVVDGVTARLAGSSPSQIAERTAATDEFAAALTGPASEQNPVSR